MELSDEQWKVLEPLLPEYPSGKPGRPWRSHREVLDAILWVLRTGAPWRDLPEKYPPYQTCHRRFKQWSMDGTFEKIEMALMEILEKRKQINMSECSIDAKFIPAKKGGECVGKTKCGKGTKLVAITEKRGRPVSVLITSASCHEVRLVEPALDACWTSESPAVLIGDKAYDSDPLDAALRRRGTEMVSPHRKNRKKPATQDGRRLRRYKRRFKVERFFSWLEDFRRLVVRWEYYAELYLGFVLLACISMQLKYL